MAGKKHTKPALKVSGTQGLTPGRPIGLARLLQKGGYGTRKETGAIIAAGRVTVDDEVVKDPAFMAEPGHSLKLDGRELQAIVPTYFAFHKPARVVCAASDGPDRRKVSDFLPPDIPGLKTVGRMDSKTTGLVLISNDSSWNNGVTRSSRVDQEYRIQVEGELSELEISVITAGIHMPNLGIFKPSSVRIVEKLNGRTVMLMVTRGTKARMIRRMFSTLRHKITLLRRIRVGDIRLGSLPSGGVRQLNDLEVKAMRKLGLHSATDQDPTTS